MALALEEMALKEMAYMVANALAGPLGALECPTRASSRAILAETSEIYTSYVGYLFHSKSFSLIHPLLRIELFRLKSLHIYLPRRALPQHIPVSFLSEMW